MFSVLFGLMYYSNMSTNQLNHVIINYLLALQTFLPYKNEYFHIFAV